MSIKGMCPHKYYDKCLLGQGVHLGSWPKRAGVHIWDVFV